MALMFDLCFSTNRKRHVLSTQSGEGGRLSSCDCDLLGGGVRCFDGALRQDAPRVYGAQRRHHRRAHQLELHPSQLP